MKFFFVLIVAASLCVPAFSQIGVGAKAPKKATVYFDGSRKMLDEKWTYWDGPSSGSDIAD